MIERDIHHIPEWKKNLKPLRGCELHQRIEEANQRLKVSEEARSISEAERLREASRIVIIFD